MNEEQRQRGLDLKVDQANLYREEVFTDLKVGTIRRLLPVKQDGSLDKSRETLFSGHAQILTPAGPLPVQAPLKAANLQQAIERFPAAISAAIEQLFAELEDLRRKEATRIITPQEAGGKIVVP